MSSSACDIVESSPPVLRAAPGFANGAEHLLAELSRLRLLLHREVLRLRASGLLNEDQFRGLYVSDEQVDAVLRERYAKLSKADPGENFPPAMSQLSQRARASAQEIKARTAASAASGISLPLSRLAEIFSLSASERDGLLLCVAIEVDLGFETLCSYAQNDVTRKRPTPDLLLRLLCDSPAECLEHRDIFSTTGTLLGAPLLRLAENTPDREASFLARPLKAEERIVDFLLDGTGLDNRLRPFTTKLTSTGSLSDLHLPAELPDELRNAARSFAGDGGVLLFHGPKGAGKRSAALALAAEMGRPLLCADLGQLGGAGLSLSTALSLLGREALLQGANLHLALAQSPPNQDPAQQQAPLVFPSSLLSTHFLVSLGSESPHSAAGPALGCRSLAFEFPVPSVAARIRVWDEAVAAGNGGRTTDLDMAALAGKFVLTGGEIRSACRHAKDRALLRGAAGGAVAMADLEAAARGQSNQTLRRLAQKVSPTCRWSDLVLPPRAIQQLREVCATEKHRHLVYSTWGFDRRLSLGKGLNVLFHGSSGTGKTMAASILAQELGLDLYKIDLSTVVSKYIGETEKQLSQIFREAQSSNASLFFDEADALFGKRSEVKDAHDRYANIEVGYLLQKMEEYEGIVILATNFRKNMDEAFTRRMHFIIEFPFPDAPNRERIWKTLIPLDAPLADDVNFAFLARQFELAGGNIRNVALAAAFLAAAEGSPIRMEHFILATARELQKLGRMPSRTEFREYYDLTRTQE